MTPKPVLLAMGGGLALLLASSCLNRPDFIWNRTESVPRGLYLVDRSANIERGDLVAFVPSDADRAWLVREGIVGPDWPLLKHVAGLEGDKTCRSGPGVFINGKLEAKALETARSGGALPTWTGCRTLQSGDVFLLNNHPGSVDGRYFGVQDRHRILGVARPIWTCSKQPAEDQSGVKTVESGSGKASVSRRARLRSCPTGPPNLLSAHLFPCDTGPDGARMDLGCRNVQTHE
jgi:conjugative transfer signal peptidase TraF